MQRFLLIEADDSAAPRPWLHYTSVSLCLASPNFPQPDYALYVLLRPVHCTQDILFDIIKYFIKC